MRDFSLINANIALTHVSGIKTERSVRNAYPALFIKVESSLRPLLINMFFCGPLIIKF